MFVLKKRKIALCSLAFSPDGTKLAATGQRGFVQVWDLAAKELDRELSTGASSNESVMFLSAAHLGVVVAGGKLATFDLADGGKRGELPLGDDPRVRAAAVSPDGKRICLALMGLTACRTLPELAPAWDLPEDKEAHMTWPLSLGWSLDGRSLAMGRFDGIVTLHDGATGKEQGRLGEKGWPQAASVALSPDGGALAWCASAHLRIHHQFGKTHFLAVAWHPAGAFLATANGDGKVDYWDAVTGERRESFDWKAGKLHALAFDAAGDRAACCSANGDIIVWDVDR